VQFNNIFVILLLTRLISSINIELYKGRGDIMFVSKSATDFSKIQHAAMSLVQEENYEAALKLLEEAKPFFTEKLDRIGHWKSGIYMLQGKHKDALSELEEVLNKGLWWNPVILENDSELQPLKGTKEFQAILEVCSKRYEEEKSGSHASLQVQGNPKAETSILALHWKGSNAKDFAEQWSKEVILSRYLIGFSQSSQLFSYNCYAWDDPNIAEADIVETYNHFKEKYELLSNMTILAGASQGGNKSIELALQENAVDVLGFVALVPAITDIEAMEKLVRESVNSSVRGCVITGDQDPFYEKTVEAVDALNANGVACKLIVNEGLGHQLPEEFSNQLTEAVEFVLNS
jgi:predicted esterase